MSLLVITTLVVAANYFLQPNIELELKRNLTRSFSLLGLSNTVIEISGRDVILVGAVNTRTEAIKAEEVAKQVWGIRKIDNQLLIINHPTE